ncbi:MAG: type 1 glutamine amidotransferase [Leptospiraceae bacterium]|nr:type 1 glutamine amidotransferase [Leptospiraceae bacterium]
MRSLIVRFADCEGPGIIESILREKGYRITYHDSYKKGLELVPSSHQIFDLIILMGGPNSVANPAEEDFFSPYLSLVENAIATDKKILGICLGSQILAKVLGSNVVKGEKGEEVGFGNCKILDASQKVFANISTSELPVFHLHEDTYEIPKTATPLLSSEKYSSQMFSYKDKAFGIQCHLEMTYPMLEVWHKRFSNVSKTISLNEETKKKTSEVNASGKIVLQNIINL